MVIGNGNVAVDVARMLALTPEELAPTDTTDAAIEAIASAGIEEIVMVGRRGPAQAAFTTPELIELGELAGADVIVDPADLEGAEPKDTNAERNLEVLREYAARTPQGKPRRLVLRFFRSPIAMLGDERVDGVELVRNMLDENERAVATDEHRDARLPASSSAASATAASRSRASRSTRRAARSRTSAAASRDAACTRPAGSSAGRAASSARTRRTRRETVELLLERPAGRTAHVGRDVRRRRGAARRARRAAHRLRRLVGDRRARARPRASRSGGRA